MNARVVSFCCVTLFLSCGEEGTGTDISSLWVTEMDLPSTCKQS